MTPTKDDALAALVSDETLNYAWGNANFGSSNKRDVIFDTLLKVTAGYHSGHTAMTICTELDLIGGYTSGSKIFLTGKGREYFYTACKQFQALTQPRETVSTTMDYDLFAPVAHYFNGDAENTRSWFETPNPNLGGMKPIDTPRDRLLKFITEQTSPQPPVDVEALKCEAREAVYHRQKNIAEPDVVQDIVWGCIDYLVSKGYLPVGEKK